MTKKTIYLIAIISFIIVAGVTYAINVLFNRISVSYVVNGETYVVTHIARMSIDEIGEPTIPKGYRFVGWYSDPNYTIEIPEHEIFVSNTTIYPLFEARRYSVNYLSNDGSGEFKIDGMLFDSVFEVQNKGFEREHYDFLGYSFDSNLDYSTDNDKILRVGDRVVLTSEGMDLYAVWRGEDIVVNVDMTSVLIDGQAIEDLSWQIRYGEEFVLPNLVDATNALDSSKVFGGYVVNGVVYAAGETIIATSDTNAIDISVNWLDNPTLYVNITSPVDHSTKQITYEGNKLDTIHTYSFLEDFTLDGHTLSEELELVESTNYTATSILCNDTKLALDGNFSTDKFFVILQVEFVGDERAVQLYNEDELIKTLQYNYGDVIELPRIYNDKKAYLGYSNVEYAGTHPQYVGLINATFDNNSKLYVDWRAPIVYINANGGVGSFDAFEVPFDSTFTFSATQISQLFENITRKYYTLVGFSEDSLASTGSYTATVQDDNVLTLFAVWQRNQATITFADTYTDSTLPGNVEVDEGSYYTLTEEGFSKDYYEIVGFTYNGETYALGEEIFIENNATLIPIWTEISIEFVGAGTINRVTLADGTTCGIQDLSGGEAIIAPNCASINGTTRYDYKDVDGVRYYFAGWDTNADAKYPTYYFNDTVINYNTSLTLHAIYMPETKGLAYTSNGNGTYNVDLSSIDSLIPSYNTLIIPNEYRLGDVKYPVVGIKGWLYPTTRLVCTNTHHLIIADGITSINSSYFSAPITSLTIPESVTSIGNSSFYQCPNLSSIYFNAINFNDSSSSTSVFGGSGVDVNVTIGKNVTKIPAYFIAGKSKTMSVVFEEGSKCTSIGSYAFQNCSNLDGITIPSSVTSIGSYAFNGCTNLTSINIPDGVTKISDYAFQNCSNLDGITIPNSVTSINQYAFSGCSKFTSVTIPSSVTSMNGNAFRNCTSLSNIIVDEANTAYSSLNGVLYDKNKTTLLFCVPTFEGDLIIPSSVTSLNGAGAAFSGCTSLTSVVIPEGVTFIPVNTFYGCTSLTSITLPSSLNNVMALAFQNCSNLARITIPSSVTSFDNSAFNGCYKVEVVNLSSVTISSSYVLKVITSEANRGIFTTIDGVRYYIDSSNKKIAIGLVDESVTDIVIDNGTIGISSYAFSDCTSLVSVTIPSSVTSIDQYAFSGCTSLTSINMPEGVTSIGYRAFSGCTSLTSINIPSSVTSIDNYAFIGCRGLTSIQFNATNCSRYGSYPNYGVFDSAGIDGEGINVTIGSNVTRIPINFLDSYDGGERHAKVISVVFEEGSQCANIPREAFKGCSLLTSITIPESVTSIGNNVFSGCYKLEIVNLSSVELTSSHGIDSVRSVVTSADEGITTTINGVKYCINTSQNTKVAIGLADELATNVVIDNDTTSISSYAFSDCTSLTSVVIPESITSIGNSAFYGCSSLTSINIPSSVTSIGNSAFSGCTSLTSINIPSSVTSIGNSAFSGCRGLTSIQFNAINCADFAQNNYVFSGNVGFAGDGITLTIGKNVTKIPAYLFTPVSNSSPNPPKITSVIFEEGSQCVSIGERAFTSSPALTSITLPEGITSIGASAFSSCSKLTSITIPSSVTSIGNSAFNSCSMLTGIITIPEGVTSIGASVFSSCYKLEGVIIPESVTSIGNSAFNSCRSITSITIPSSVTSIGSNVFSGCYGLEILNLSSVELTSSHGIGDVLAVVTSEEDRCTLTTINGVKYYINASQNKKIAIGLADESITDIVIDNGTTGICGYAFYGCINLKSATIPSSVTSMGNYAFNVSIIFVVSTGKPSGWGSYAYTTAYYYSDIYKSGCWHYVDGVPTFW